MNQIAQQMYARKVADANTRVRVGVGVVVRDEKGRVLLERRSDCGWWGLPGGRIEPGESAIEAAVREVKEETGLTIRVIRLLGVYSEPSERIVTFLDNSDVVQLVDILLEATIFSGTLTCSSESLDLRFFEPGCLPSEIVPPARVPLEDVAAGRVGVVR
jgi:8-oxo-dGTP pyrophosphatase MutT (NUDIX family)